MARIQVSEKQLKTLVRASVKDALKTEFIKLRVMLVPWVSDAEQRDVERRYKIPSRKAAVARTFEL